MFDHSIYLYVTYIFSMRVSMTTPVNDAPKFEILRVMRRYATVKCSGGKKSAWNRFGTLHIILWLDNNKNNNNARVVFFNIGPRDTPGRQRCETSVDTGSYIARVECAKRVCVCTFLTRRTNSTDDNSRVSRACHELEPGRTRLYRTYVN